MSKTEKHFFTLTEMRRKHRHSFFNVDTAHFLGDQKYHVFQNHLIVGLRKKLDGRLCIRFPVYKFDPQTGDFDWLFHAKSVEDARQRIREATQ